ncbi:hypothetical protein [Candidatus Chlorohelix sp.]|uniref:hypothetical protein n=1 Tax=Candidatus Chlorohelix sp. TaxID=3139201 RepID=UPI003042DC13
MADDIKIKVKDAEVDALEELDTEVGGSSGLFGVNVGKTVLNLVKLEYNLVTAPLALFPKKTRVLAKQTTVDFFQTIRSFVDRVTDDLEEIVVSSLEKDKAAE